jgi:hypothetical protein
MKVPALLVALFLLLVHGCSTPALNGIPPQLPDPDVEHKLRSILPEGWSLLTEDNTFTLSRNEKVWLYVQVGWDIRGRSFEENVKKYGSEEKYEIILRFEPRLSDSEFQKLKLERESYERALNEGTRSKNEWADGIQEFYKHRVPIYVTDKYSVFAEKSDDYPVRIYPESVLPECRRVVASLDSLFQRYQKSVGQASDF